MKTRVISAIVGIALMIGILFLQTVFPYALFLAVAAMTAVAGWEVANCTGIASRWYFLTLGIVMSLLLPVSLLFSSEVRLSMLLVGLALIAFLYFASAILSFGKLECTAIAAAFVLTLTQSVGFTCLLAAFSEPSCGGFLFAMILVGSWSSDTGAYFIGRSFGKHKLTPVSPKKTLEGFLGGLATSVLGFFLCCGVYIWFFAAENAAIRWWELVPLGLITSVVSVVGDLSFSLVKRYFGIKDYGRIMPGHGGILDRFDSVIFVAPFLYLVFQYFPVLY